MHFRTAVTSVSTATMSLGPVARYASPLSPLLRPSFTRCASSKAKRSLPPQKVRSLISLYHQSGDFITPANLSEKIDQVFTTNHYSHANSGVTFNHKGDLIVGLHARKSAPRIGEPNDASTQSDGRWTGMAARDREVQDALYGTHRKLPGLDVLLDEEESIKTLTRDDKQNPS
jgi:hypothetical protein